jgi:hypothetical protein
VSTARCIHRLAVGCAVTGALLVSALSGTAAARSDQQAQRAQALAQERAYMGEPGKVDATTPAALAQERYYSTYGTPEPLNLPRLAAPSDPTPWLPIALSVAVVLALVALPATRLRRVRHRAARVTG